ncbi:MAG: ribosome assembly RNA-binding protein YhbY [Gammaproteobacteria bacterium]|nr:ribosome assembly RNA-binding protein YhbY [Gammaproteobacteria bacterium]
MAHTHELRKKAHSLKPVVMIGGNGLTEAVLKEIDRALFDHELIKIKIAVKDKDEKKQLTEQICEHTQAELIQSIGHTITVYRERIE